MNSSPSLSSTEQQATLPGYTLWQMVRYMLRLGTLGFGGPVALVGYMYRDLVEERHWISDADYKEGMALAQLMPGPLAAQLASRQQGEQATAQRRPMRRGAGHRQVTSR